MTQPVNYPWSLPPVRETWEWSEQQRQAWQLDRLNEQLREILPGNRFYREKLGCDSYQLETLDQLADLPFTSKDELVASAAEHQGISAHHTYPIDRYSRVHRTSGTTGRPLLVMDTQEDWHRWSWTWQHVLEAADVTTADRVFLAFSFGPFIGFWSAHQACIDRGATVIPGGGLTSLARLQFMQDTRATVICCTPSYALYLAEVAQHESFPLAELDIRSLIVAGEAGGSVPSVRKRIEEAWQAQVVDHSGATEIGPWGFGWPERPGLHINEASFIAELLPLNADRPEDDAHELPPLRELVLTSLGRHGVPVLRYRTGDSVIAERPKNGPCNFLWLPDGVLGRTDDMVTVRGVNIFPSSIDAIVRRVDEIVEYRVTVFRENELDQLRLEIEIDKSVGHAERVVSELQKHLGAQIGLRIPVELAGSLPRSEAKSKRWQDRRAD